MRIQRRWTLVLVLSAFQIALLLSGFYVIDGWSSARLRDTLRSQILADNETASNVLAREVSDVDFHDLQYGDERWDTLHAIVRESNLPNDGMVCVIRTEDGALLCHPAIDDPAKLAQMKPGGMTIHTDMGQMTIVNAARHSDEMKKAVSGWAEMPDGVHYLAIHSVAGNGISWMVHQRQTAVNESVEATLFPIRIAGASVVSVMVLLSIVFNIAVVRRYESRLARWNARLEKTVADRTRALTKTRNAVVFGLAKLSESRDNDTGSHLDRIRDYTVELAEELRGRFSELTDGYRHDLAIASSLHDIGKVGIPDQVLLKPGALDPEERKIINEHSAIGGECLAAIQRELGEDDFLEMGRQVAYYHHERWDGQGYPHGLKADQIPLSARIVAVADVYDALTSERPYKSAMTHEKAAAIIADGSGTQFDPVIVDAFFAREDKFRQIRGKYHDEPTTDAEAQRPMQFSRERSDDDQPGVGELAQV